MKQMRSITTQCDGAHPDRVRADPLVDGAHAEIDQVVLVEFKGHLVVDKVHPEIDKEHLVEFNVLLEIDQVLLVEFKERPVVDKEHQEIDKEHLVEFKVRLEIDQVGPVEFASETVSRGDAEERRESRGYYASPTAAHGGPSCACFLRRPGGGRWGGRD